MSQVIQDLPFHRVTLALLGRDVLPLSAKPFELISAAMAVRQAVQPSESRQPMLFAVPNATSSTARIIAAGLLIGSYAHENGAGRIPAVEVRRLLKGNILFVTQAVSECVEALEALRLSKGILLKEFWDIVPLGKQNIPASSKQRIFVTNPGWMESRVGNRRFSGVIIDASHPRALKRLPVLLDQARHHSDLCVVVAPPISAYHLDKVGYPRNLIVWIWDPRAQANAAAELKETPALDYAQQHTLCICEDDPEYNELLAGAHRRLAEVGRLSHGRRYEGLPIAWSILKRLAAVSVPLPRLEQHAANTWSGTLASRLQLLREVNGSGNPTWDSTWPGICEALEITYRAMLKRQDPAKFWATALLVDRALKDGGESVRIVVPSEAEAQLLSELLQAIVDNFSAATACGRLEVTTFADEARSVAEGRLARTILLGGRPPQTRYLDLYPQEAVEQVVYPCEAAVADANLERQYSDVLALQGTSRRELLAALSLELIATVGRDQTGRPTSETKRIDGKPVQVSRSSDVSADLDIDELVDSSRDSSGLWTTGGEAVSLSGMYVLVTFEGGITERYPVEHSLDVWYPESEETQRISVGKVTIPRQSRGLSIM